MTLDRRLGVRVPVFIALGVLAGLSLLEAAAPGLKWFTFPAMVAVVIFLIGAALFYRARGVAHIVKALRKAPEPEKLDHNQPIHPR